MENKDTREIPRRALNRKEILDAARSGVGGAWSAPFNEGNLELVEEIIKELGIISRTHRQIGYAFNADPFRDRKIRIAVSGPEGELTTEPPSTPSSKK